MRKLGIWLLLCTVLLAPVTVYGQDEPRRAELVIEHDDEVHSVDWHPSEKIIASASGEFIYLWDAETGELLNSIEAYIYSTTVVTWNPQGNRLASLGLDSSRYPPNAIARIWGAESGMLLIELGAGMETIQWHPNGGMLLTVNDMIPEPDEETVTADERMNVVSLWSSGNGYLESRFSLNGESNGLSHTRSHPVAAVWISNYHFVMVNAHGPISIWNHSTFSITDIFLEPTDSWADRVHGGNQSAAWNPTRNLLAVTSWDVINGPGITVFNLLTDEVTRVDFTYTTEQVTALEWSPNGRWLAAGYHDGEIQIIDGRLIDFGVAYTFQDDDTITSVTWSPDSQYLASSSGDTVRIRALPR